MHLTPRDRLAIPFRRQATEAGPHCATSLFRTVYVCHRRGSSINYEVLCLGLTNGSPNQRNRLQSEQLQLDSMADRADFASRNPHSEHTVESECESYQRTFFVHEDDWVSPPQVARESSCSR